MNKIDKPAEKINSLSKKDAALYYASKGLHVLPLHNPTKYGCSCDYKLECKGRPICAENARQCVDKNGKKICKRCKSPGKHPRTKIKNTMTCNAETITGWWSRWPEANIGVFPANSGHVVIDVDVHHGAKGVETLSRWRQFIGDVNFYVDATGSGGGKHFLFKVPNDLKIVPSRDSESGKTINRKINGLGPGIDIITGKNSLIVMAPSDHASGGKYVYESGDLDNIPMLPERWCAWAPMKTKHGSSYISAGERNEFMAKQLGGSLQGTLYPVDQIPVVMREADQVLLDSPLDEKELEATINSVLQMDRTLPDGSTAASGASRRFDPYYGIAHMLPVTDKSDLVEAMATMVMKQNHFWWNGDPKSELKWWDKSNGTWFSNGEEYIKALAIKYRAAMSPQWKSKTQPRHKPSVSELSRGVLQVIVAILQQRKMGDFPMMVPNAIPFSNGIYNWKTKTFKAQYEPEDYATYKLAVDYDPKQTCPWVKNTLMAKWVDPELMPLLFEIIGLTFLRYQPLEIAFFVTGSGKNGKSVFLRLVGDILGDDNTTNTPPHTLTENFVAISLFEKHANIVGEIPATVLDDTSIFKQATGTDMITADRKFLQPIKFRSHATFICSTNEMPPTTDKSLGFIRRLRFVDFKEIPEPDRIFGLGEKIAEHKSELSGVVNEALKALEAAEARNWVLTGELSEVDNRLELLKKSRPLEAFIELCCRVDSPIDTPCSRFCELYNNFAEKIGAQPESQTKTTRYLRRNFFIDGTKQKPIINPMTDKKEKITIYPRIEIDIDRYNDFMGLKGDARYTQESAPLLPESDDDGWEEDKTF